VSVSMHDPHQAAKELERAVKELGLLGVMLNDFQEAEDSSKMLWYDQPEYDPFWAKVEELDSIFLMNVVDRISVLHSPETSHSGCNGASLGRTSCVVGCALPIRYRRLRSRFPSLCFHTNETDYRHGRERSI
jgi:predicted TIM-barrel fold metal-dependent hydrolase